MRSRGIQGSQEVEDVSVQMVGLYIQQTHKHTHTKHIYGHIIIGKIVTTNTTVQFTIQC